MDAKKAIEEGRSYLSVMTDRRMKPDEADAKKMQKIEKFIEKTERKKLPSPNKRRESGSSEGVQEQVPKNTKERERRFLGTPDREFRRESRKAKVRTKSYKRLYNEEFDPGSG